MTALTGPSSSDHGVPSSPLVLASGTIQSSPLCKSETAFLRLHSPIHPSAGHVEVPPWPKGGLLQTSQQHYSITTGANCAYLWRPIASFGKKKLT